MFDRLTEVSLVPFTSDELSLLASRYFNSDDDGKPIIVYTWDVEAPYTDVYATLAHYHMTGWDHAEGGYGIWDDVEQKAWRVNGTVTNDDLDAIKSAILASLTDVRTNEQGEIVGYSNESEFGSFHVRFTIGRPYTHTPYFGYC